MVDIHCGVPNNVAGVEVVDVVHHAVNSHYTMIVVNRRANRNVI